MFETIQNFTKDLLKIKINKHDKKPAQKWRNLQKNTKQPQKNIDTNIFNVALLTGKINNILVVDVDKKDNGIEEFEKYINEFGEIKTIKQNTPSGGYHLFFKYTSSNSDDQFLIENYLKNKSKYRNGKGIDIRSNGGYVIIAPSEYIYDKTTIKKYEFENNQNELLEMPTSLINFILMGTKQALNKQLNKTMKLHEHKNLNEFKYKITEDEVKQLLLKLDFSYCDNTEQWLTITSIMKSLNYYHLWDGWSTMSKKYDKKNNLKYGMIQKV